METLIKILPGISNIGALVFLMFFIYSALGMNLFGLIQLKEYLNEQANFQTFISSMLVLMRCSTGESWNAIMYDCVYSNGHEGVACNPD